MRACCRLHRALEEAGALVRRVAPEGGGGGGRGKGWQRHKLWVRVAVMNSREPYRVVFYVDEVFVSKSRVVLPADNFINRTRALPCAIRSGTCPGTQKKVKSPVLSRWLLAVPVTE